MTGITGLPKITLKIPYKKRPLNEHSMLTKGALHIPSIKGLMHPASTQMKVHISNGMFGGGDLQGWGKH